MGLFMSEMCFVGDEFKVAIVNGFEVSIKDHSSDCAGVYITCLELDDLIAALIKSKAIMASDKSK